MPLAQISERRLAANRANARKSTGPRTPEGKRQSSQNACQHHLYARKFTLSPEAAAANEARARRDSAGVPDPALRELYYRLILATGHCEMNWSLRDGLEAHARSLFPGDPQLADWWMLHQSNFLAALHRHECFYTRQTLEILKTIDQLQRAELKNRPRAQTTQDRTHAAPQPQTHSNATLSDYRTTRLPFNGVHILKVQTPWLPDPETEFEPVYPVPADSPAPLTFAAPRNMSERTHSQPEPESQPSPAVPNTRPFPSAKTQNTSERTHSQIEPPPTPAIPANQPAPLTFAAPRNISERTQSHPEPDYKPQPQPALAAPSPPALLNRRNAEPEQTNPSHPPLTVANSRPGRPRPSPHPNQPHPPTPDRRQASTTTRPAWPVWKQPHEPRLSHRQSDAKSVFYTWRSAPFVGRSAPLSHARRRTRTEPASRQRLMLANRPRGGSQAGDVAVTVNPTRAVDIHADRIPVESQPCSGHAMPPEPRRQFQSGISRHPTQQENPNE